MKKIVYKTPAVTLVANDADGLIEVPIVGTAEIPYSEENLEYVESVALNGEYTVEDDGEAELTQEERIAELEEQNAMLMECLLEMSEIVYA